MNLLPFGDLAPYSRRTFVPASIDWDDWGPIEGLFDKLEEAAQHCKTPASLEQWLHDWGELAAALDEEGSRRYIAMTCHTDNDEAEQAYLRFVENIEPRLKPRRFRLAKLYLDHPLRPELPPERYSVFDRDIAVLVELFREENIPLQTEETRLEQQYQKLTGSLTVQFRGVEHTLVQMGKYLEEPDRALRQEAWELVATRRLEEKDNLEDIFDRLVELRQQIARNAGFDNYRDYAFRARGRFDYTPEDCLQFHHAIEREVMPLVRELQAERRRRLEVETLRPWDLAVDPAAPAPLRPFDEVDRLVSGCGRIFDRLDPELAEGFGKLREMQLLDLDNRKGKAPGGYQSTLEEARLPFIFMNAIGLQRDVETLLHESGHAFHALAARDEEFYFYRGAPIEFCEVASMSMELLGGEHIEEFYNADESRRARLRHLEGVIDLFPWVATVDAFQHWIYTHPGHSREDRRSAWLRLMDRFGGEVDWTGLEDARGYVWHRQLHIFISPFYYVEYGIAQLGALQVWLNSKRDTEGALRDYKSALALGGSRALPDLFSAAGCVFRFDSETVRPLADLARRELAKLRV